ncbi:hypothetical protein KSP40_PGU019959 [Platanthera guangdongensis]|uniref:Uncharacterized protein n=1 Tax=Platanthera guangdongensis TaxID=2320717 RepID=A0ABR2LVP5_9ASPA
MASASFPAPTFSLSLRRGFTRVKTTHASLFPSFSGLDSGDRATCLSEVSYRRSSNHESWILRAIRAELPPEKMEPMVPPYNVLITGSTKGTQWPLPLRSDFFSDSPDYLSVHPYKTDEMIITIFSSCFKIFRSARND